MTPAEIQDTLKENDTTQKAIAAEMEPLVAEMTISKVIHRNMSLTGSCGPSQRRSGGNIPRYFPNITYNPRSVPHPKWRKLHS